VGNIQHVKREHIFTCGTLHWITYVCVCGWVGEIVRTRVTCTCVRVREPAHAHDEDVFGQFVVLSNAMPVWICECMRGRNTHTHIRTHTIIQAHTRKNTHTNTHTRTHTRTRTRINTNTHTNTHTHTRDTKIESAHEAHEAFNNKHTNTQTRTHTHTPHTSQPLERLRKTQMRTLR